VYFAGIRRLWRNAGAGKGVSRLQAAAFAGGIVTLFIALEALHELSEQLFVVHMIQHELLMLVAAPLVALGGPLVAYLWALPSTPRRAVVKAVRRRPITAAWAAVTAPAAVWLLHGLALWTWHLPALYEAAVRSESVHIAQHLSFFLSATLFWWGLAHGRYGRAGYGVAVVYLFATAVHSGVLGALLTFSPRVWYPIYQSTTAAFGLTPLEDQQLAGLVMWVPASIIFVAGGLLFFAAWLRESERRVRLTALVCLAAAAIAAAAACTTQTETYNAAARMTGGDPARGRAVIHQYGCDSCHQIPGIGSSANSHVGPPLTSIAQRVYLAGHLPNTPASMEQWIRHPRQVDPRTAMPESGVSEADGRDIAAYLYTLR
jgi:cytochrome c oxidase assembly factor CtaG